MPDRNVRRERALRQIEPYARRARGFAGWSFSDVEVLPLEPGPAWDYEALARERAGSASALLDLGTGGGEVLSRIIAGLPTRAVATEEWSVNAPVARARLAPLGVSVVRASSLALPFGKGSFDLVLDRHEALEPAEVARVLRPGGWALTQQVGHDDWSELSPFFPNRHDFPDIFAAYVAGFRAAGLAVATAERHSRRVAYRTLGDLAYMLLLAPWSFPDFDPARDIDALLAIEDALGASEGIVVTESRFLIVAAKTA